MAAQVCLFVFSLEIVLSSIGKPGYFMGLQLSCFSAFAFAQRKKQGPLAHLQPDEVILGKCMKKSLQDITHLGQLGVRTCATKGA